MLRCLRTDDDLCEPYDRGAAQQLGNGHLLVTGVILIEQHPLLEPAVQATLDDLGQCRLGLALVLRYGLDRLALGGDLVGRHIVAVQVGGAGEGDMDRKVVGELGGAALELDGHRVDPAAGLLVQVGVDDRVVARLDAHDTPTEMFSFSVVLRRSTSSWSSAGASSPFEATRAASSSARETNSADFATKSVSQRSSTMAATLSWRTTATAPWLAWRSARLALSARPFSRSQRVAASLSPPFSSSARWRRASDAGRLAERLDVLCGE